MKKQDKLFIGILVVLGAISLIIGNFRSMPRVIGPSALQYEMNKEGRYISTDEVAKMIMEKDPSLLLVDVRSPEEYAKYSIEGAINIPAEKLMDPENKDYFLQDVYTTVLYSNGSSLADQAWLNLESYEYKGNRVMKGGLNEWYRTILNPLQPADKDLNDEVTKTYLFRKGAQVYFTGMQISGAAPSSKPKAASKPIIKHKKKEVSGGCG